MYLSKLSMQNFRMFSDKTEVKFSKGLNLLVGENGCGKSTVIDAIRVLLSESEFREEEYPKKIFMLTTKRFLQNRWTALKSPGFFQN